MIERAVILSAGSTLQLPPLRSIPIVSRRPSEPPHAAVPLTAPPPVVALDTRRPDANLDSVQRSHILSVLDECNWTIAGASGAAVRLGMKRSTLQFRMRKLGIVRGARSEGPAGTPAR